MKDNTILTNEEKENIEARWEKGINHHPLSEHLYKHIERVDMKNGDSFCFKSGGDGDNGETLMYLMDSWFETEFEQLLAKKVEEDLEMKFAMLRNDLFNAVSREFKFDDKFKRNNANRLWRLVCDITNERLSKYKQ